MIKPGRAATLVAIVSFAHAISSRRECGYARRVGAIEVLGIDGAVSVRSAGGRIGERAGAVGLEKARVQYPGKLDGRMRFRILGAEESSMQREEHACRLVMQA